MRKQLIVASFLVWTGLCQAQTNVFPANGNVGIGTTSPTAKVSFANTNMGTDPNGLSWFNDSPLQYAIHRTQGLWQPPNYQQLRMSWGTGIILDPASDGNLYNPSYVEVKGKGLRVSSGSVGIGVGILNAPSGYLLAVGGKSIMDEIKVKPHASGWPDYVFKPGYQLMPLHKVERFIKEKGHLPEMPSAEEVGKNGVELGSNQALLLKKIEEMTLYLISINKRVEGLEAENKLLKKQLEKALVK